MQKIILLAILGVAIISCKNTNKENILTPVVANQVDSIRLSLAEWSFHKALKANEMDNLDFAAKAGSMGFSGIEYVNQFFKDKARDTAYLTLLNQNAAKAGVKQLLIMIDEEGNLADTDKKKRFIAVANHHKWVDAAAFLGCHSIRVNAQGEGTPEEVAEAAVDGLSQLANYAASKNINVIVENHGGYSSNGEWLAKIMHSINLPNCGTLPDFGNFCLKRDENNSCVEEYDRYKGVSELMPFAKAVSAKSFDFGELGFETSIDYTKMLGIVTDAGYGGYIGVEYEGDKLGEEEGIIATKNLIEKCLAEISATLK